MGHIYASFLLSAICQRLILQKNFTASRMERCRMTDRRTIKKINGCIRRIALGSAEAPEELFTLTKRQLLIVAKSYLWDKSKAEDVLSDSYCKAVKGAKAFDSKRNGYSWLYEIVKNTALNQNARDKLRAHLPLEEPAAPSFDVIDELLNRVMVEEAALPLSDEERKLVYRYFFEGLTLQEIANRTGKPKTTVYDMLKRTLAKMRKSLGIAEHGAGKSVYKGERNDEEKRD